jgi:DNA-binding response OmpR family regulator
MRKRVMIIDDDAGFLEELEETLTLSGYEVEPVNDASLALDAAVYFSPDVILMDVRMPKKSGFQVTSELRRFQALRSIPVIAMTAHFKDDYIRLMNICGIERYLKKPFSPLEIVAKIETILFKKHQRSLKGGEERLQAGERFGELAGEGKAGKNGIEASLFR